ncbi:hypothetical protein R1sor_027036 [Riccia sorocarpa]|uniref:CCHC-type domain-containing protein n=1 Tax=Riccia sorocarpa TaxID=122646 RepID=A0ABD3GD42_9MARC
MTKPLPSILVLHMNSIQKKIKIWYDTLPDACFKCHECGHLARICPKNQQSHEKGKKPTMSDPEDGFQEGVPLMEHELSQAPSLQEHIPITGSETLPDLNVTPTAPTGTPSSKSEKKKSKKARQKERRKEASANREKLREVEMASPILTNTDSKGVGESDSSESEDEEGGENRMWKNPGGKKQKGSVFYVASVYGPHLAEEKIAFYNWLQNQANGKNWMLAGDWNMVLDQEDSMGPTPLLKGGPLQAWNAVQMEWHLEDVFHITQTRSGPKYTRQVVMGDRLDQSRLNRAYISNNMNWVREVNRVAHDGGKALSDHHPVTLEFNILGQSSRWNRGKKTCYTKMDIDSMKHPERRRLIKQAWEEG